MGITKFTINDLKKGVGIMPGFFSDISFELLVVLGLNFLLIIILFLMNMSNRLSLKRLKIKYNKFMSDVGETNIEQLLEKCIDKVNDVTVKNKEIKNDINNIERNLIHCYQKLGVVRYNAFENVGSDLSFSIALLDTGDNGVVLSGIYSRDSSSTYAKPIIGGKSKYSLSAEEIQALETAKKTSREGFYTDK